MECINPLVDLEQLRYSHETLGIPISYSTTCLAAKQGNLLRLKYALEHIEKLSDSQTINISHRAAWGGHVDCLRYAHERGCLIDQWTYVEATKNNNVPEANQLACLQYLVQYLGSGELPLRTIIGRSALHNSIINNHFTCVRFIHENLISEPLNISFINACVHSSIEHDNINCLQYMHENGYQIPTIDRLFVTNHPDCLVYLDKLGRISDDTLSVFS